MVALATPNKRNLCNLVFAGSPRVFGRLLLLRTLPAIFGAWAGNLADRV